MNIFLRSAALLLTVSCMVLQDDVAKAQAVGTWTNTGPVSFPVNVSGQVHGIGRVSQIKFHATDPQKMYAASASGGLFISGDNGATWAPTPGSEQLPRTSTSAVCINPANDQIMYLSLGDADYYSDDYGIYKTTDGGATWNASNSGMGNAMAVEILMSPLSNSTLVAATSQGIYKSTNSGASWSLKQSGVFTDMKAKPGSNTMLYAATATGFLVSTDFGSTWTETLASSSFPANNGGNRIAVSAANPARVYLVTTDDNGRILQSSDSGNTFTTVHNSATQCIVCYDEDPNSGSQGNYDLDINANPANADELLVVAHCVWRSTDGGATWNKRTDWYDQVHTDMHQIQWNPWDNTQIFQANDGGVWLSTDTDAQDWTPRSNGLAATEIYHAAQSPVLRNIISIGTQDNGELYYDNDTWKTNRGGDWGSREKIDYSNKGTVYYMESGNRRDLEPLGGDYEYNSPITPYNASRIEFVHSAPGTAFHGYDDVYRSTDIDNATPAWTLIKSNSESIQDIASCKANSNILYVVTDQNHVLRTLNALAATPSWTTITTPSSTNTRASLSTTRKSDSLVYLTCGSNVYRSNNRGTTWSNITGTGLSGQNIRQIIADEFSPGERLFVNAGSYVHYKNATSTAWTATTGLPTIANGSDFMVYNDSSAASILRVSTYGRGVWELNINNDMPPAADFVADMQQVCPGDSVHFTKTIYGNATSFAWSFPGGMPATSTAAAPVVAYSTPGMYAVTLTATNANGADTVIKTSYITVSYGQTTPVTEGFEETAFPPAGWVRTTLSGGQWQQSTSAGGYGASNQSALYDNYSHDADGKQDRLYTPRLNTAGTDGAILYFDVAYAVYSSEYPDSLVVEVSPDCGDSWTQVYLKTSAELATAPDYTDATFVPSATQWRTDTVHLDGFAGGSLQARFVSIGHYGQALYLDNVNLMAAPVAGFSAADTAVCAGAAVTFTASAPGATTYSWTFAGGTPSSSAAQNPVVTYNTPGTYTVSLIAGNAAGADAEIKNGYIMVVAVPVAAVTAAGGVLTATGGPGSYQWLLNGIAITGATGSTYTPSQSGSYAVIITTAAGCTDTADAYLFSLGVGGIKALPGWSVYPNPTAGKLRLSGISAHNGSFTVQCYSVAGALMSSRTVSATGNGIVDAALDYTGFPRGVYELRVSDAAGVRVLMQRLVLE